VNEVTQSKRREGEGKQYRRRSLTQAEDFKCESARKPEPHLQSSKIYLKRRRRIGKFSQRTSRMKSSNK